MVDSFSGSDRLLGTAGTDSAGKKGYVLTVTIDGSTVAHDAVDSGAPVKIGGYAAQTAPTSVAVGDRVNAWFGLDGAQVVGINGANGAPSSQTQYTTPTLAAGVSRPLAVGGYVFDGTTAVPTRGDANGTVVSSSLSSAIWNYAAATGGIVNTTTAVTIKAAAGASIRNYLKTLTIVHDTLGAATELAIRDGAGGTVLWRGKVQTAASDSSSGAGAIIFDPPLKGTANTLMEVVTLSATVTGGVFVNATGFTGI